MLLVLLRVSACYVTDRACSLCHLAYPLFGSDMDVILDLSLHTDVSLCISLLLPDAHLWTVL
jgi:hypothetical protein